jgi:hypothetical protein
LIYIGQESSTFLIEKPRSIFPFQLVNVEDILFSLSQVYHSTFEAMDVLEITGIMKDIFPYHDVAK